MYRISFFKYLMGPVRILTINGPNITNIGEIYDDIQVFGKNYTGSSA